MSEVERLRTQVLALENAGMETTAQLGEEQQLREEAEQSIDHYQHEIAEFRREIERLRDKSMRDVQRIGEMDAGIGRLLEAGEDLYGALCDGQRLGDERVHEALSAWEAVAKPPPSAITALPPHCEYCGTGLKPLTNGYCAECDEKLEE